MAPAYKLTYFNVRGVAEPIRYMFAYAGVKYEDLRLDKTDWPAHKASFPFGKVPTLEVDGKVVHQSLAICRYLAPQFGLAGDSAWDQLQIDIVVDTLGDLKTQAMDYFRLVVNHGGGPVDEVEKAKKKDVLVNETLTFYLSRFEQLVHENKGFFVNGKMSWADIIWACIMELMEGLLGEDVLKSYPHLAALKAKVEAVPSIKTWRETRPDTPM